MEASAFVNGGSYSDLMLLDIRMPGKSGLDVVREAEPKPAYPIVAMTGHVDTDAQEEFRCGVDWRVPLRDFWSFVNGCALCGLLAPGSLASKASLASRSRSTACEAHWWLVVNGLPGSPSRPVRDCSS